MKFTYSWLLEHLETKSSPAEIAEKLTALGLEVEEFSDLGAKYAPFIVAEIAEAARHPNADKLQVCKVNNGTEILQIVCGAPNARAGIKVCLAPVGANIPNGNFQIKKSKIRDVESNGMLCSADELELGGDSAGILELPADAKTGSKFADLQGLNDSLYEIAITPNRADCLGVHGIARDLAAAGLGTLKKLEIENQKSEIKSPISVKSESYYLGRYFADVKNAESPDWLKKRLLSIGQQPISALVDITNYFTFNFGRPLHVYDADKLNGNLRVEIQKSKTKFNALNNKSYELENDLVIADDKGPVALAGVIGNLETAVSAETKNVFLEVAHFAPDSVAKNGRKHQIDSDARYRFERSIDVGFMPAAVEWATKFIMNLCGGKPSEIITAGAAPQATREVNFDFAKIKTFGGVDVSKDEATKILSNLGFKVEGNKISTPTWRQDVEFEADIIEEILRIIGYEKVPAQVIPFAPAKKSDNFSRVKKLLASRGLKESVTYSFMQPQTAAAFGGGNAALQLTNPISVELSEMRPSILPNLLEAAVRNANRGFANSAFFEVGPIFSATGEQISASGIRFGENVNKNIHEKPREVDAFDAKADLLAITGNIGEVREGAPSYYHPGRSGGVFLGKNCVGYFGEIHPAICKKLDIEGAAVGFEVFLNNLPNSQKKYKKIELVDYQAVTRDFAFVLPADVKAGDIAPKVKKVDALITEVAIFDLYEGGKMEAGRKSIAISVTIQPKDKTLTDAEIETISQKAIATITSDLGGNLRS